MLNYTDIPVIINGTGLFATKGSFNVSTSLIPIYALASIGKIDQEPSGPIRGTLSFDYNINQDPIYGLFQNIVGTQATGSVTPAIVSLGDQSFAYAYLTSHGANGQANQLATARATFDLFFTGTSSAISFGNSATTAASGGSLGIGHGAASSINNVAGITDAMSFQYEAAIHYDYVTNIGSIIPSGVYVLGASKKIMIEGYSVSANISMCGDAAIASGSVSPLTPTGGVIVSYAVSGNLTSLEGSVSAGQVGKGKATITQFI